MMYKNILISTSTKTILIEIKSISLVDLKIKAEEP